MIGASALFLNPYEWEETAVHIQLPLDKKIAEIGRCMVLPEYRGKNYMYKMNSILLDIARELNIDYILSTVHPNNISSKQSLIKLGMNKVGHIKKYYERDVYMLYV